MADYVLSKQTILVAFLESCKYVRTQFNDYMWYQQHYRSAAMESCPTQSDNKQAVIAPVQLIIEATLISTAIYLRQWYVHAIPLFMCSSNISYSSNIVYSNLQQQFTDTTYVVGGVKILICYCCLRCIMNMLICRSC